MDQIADTIAKYGLETVLIAVMITVLTGLIKWPIKALAKRLNDYTKVTRFIVFLPIVLGFFLTFCYAKFVRNAFSFDRAFVTLWLTASSLSLTMYAIYEKMVPGKKDPAAVGEMETSATILEGIGQIADAVLSEESPDVTADTAGLPETDNKPSDKIILRGKTGGDVKTEK